MSVSAVDCVQPAIQHTRQQMFTGFRFGQWSRLALVGILAGELHVGGCGGFGNWAQLAQPRQKSGGQEFMAQAFPHIDPARIAQFAGLIAVLVLLAIVMFFVFLYINSVFRFILFESVLRRECSIGDGWQRWHGAGKRYFLWQLVLAISTWLSLGLLIGIPLLFMGGAGWLKDGSHHIAGIAATIVLGVGVLLIVLLALTAIQISAKDFLVPIMALEGLDFADGWSRLIGMIRAEPGRYVVYILLKFALLIAAGILFTIVAMIPALIIIIPTVLIVIAGVAAGLTWNVATISLAVIFGVIAFVVLMYLIALASAPATVFFPAYAMYFFAARYPQLGALLNPVPAPAAPALETTPEPPPFSPPLPPSPQPIG